MKAIRSNLLSSWPWPESVCQQLYWIHVRFTAMHGTPLAQSSPTGCHVVVPDGGHERLQPVGGIGPRLWARHGAGRPPIAPCREMRGPPVRACTRAAARCSARSRARDVTPTRRGRHLRQPHVRITKHNPRRAWQHPCTARAHQQERMAAGEHDSVARDAPLLLLPFRSIGICRPARPPCPAVCPAARPRAHRPRGAGQGGCTGPRCSSAAGSGLQQGSSLPHPSLPARKNSSAAVRQAGSRAAAVQQEDGRAAW
jgi:hypothetical protein